MTENILNLWGNIIWIVGGILVVLILALTVALPQNARNKPGRMGHRDVKDESVDENIRPDGYIDSFANEIEEAGGGLPPIVKVAVPGVLIWWLLYLILNWSSNPGTS